MKFPFRFLTLILLLAACSKAPSDEKIRLVRHGKDVAARPNAAFSTNVIELIQSCSVHSTEYAVSTNKWQELLQSDSFVHLTFASSRKLTVMIQTGAPRYRDEKLIDEILVPLPERAWPDHIFAKSSTNVLSFTKYDPIALRRVAFEPVLHLSSVAPYASLADLPDK